MTRVPTHATVEDQYSGTALHGPHEGQRATVKLYKGRASDGRATDYKARPARWLVIDVNGSRELAKRYTGRRYDLAREHFEEGRELVEL